MLAGLNLQDGVMPMHFAAIRGHHSFVCVLLDAGANAQAIDVENDSALYWAAQGAKRR
jgi:ankyrin repeat protein